MVSLLQLPARAGEVALVGCVCPSTLNRRSVDSTITWGDSNTCGSSSSDTEASSGLHGCRHAFHRWVHTHKLKNLQISFQLLSPLQVGNRLRVFPQSPGQDVHFS